MLKQTVSIDQTLNLYEHFYLLVRLPIQKPYQINVYKDEKV